MNKTADRKFDSNKNQSERMGKMNLEEEIELKMSQP
jgi:hypothetical protein